MNIQEAMLKASVMTEEENTTFVIGQIDGKWQIAYEGDEGRVAEMENVIKVAVDGPATGYEQLYAELACE